MILGIDAFNIRSGGCLNHLCEILRFAHPPAFGFSRVIIWGNSKTLAKIEERDWLVKVDITMLDRALPLRIFWHKFLSKKLLQDAGCSILFVPGGSEANGFSPVVSMARNMLPFEWQELFRYRYPLAIFRLILIRIAQIRSFRRANGVIFLTNYARDSILKIVGPIQGSEVIIPHGIGHRFSIPPRLQQDPKFFSDNRPFRILYVSFIHAYKHQWHVAEAVFKLRNLGIPIVLDLVGAPAEGMKRLQSVLNRIDPDRRFVKFHGVVPYEQLHKYYKQADVGIFASSCENMPNILIENMAAGLPIACSNKGPMPEILGSAGLFFDPCDSNDIANTILKMYNSPSLRKELAQSAYDLSKQYSWQKCSDEIFGFLANIAKASEKLH